MALNVGNYLGYGAIAGGAVLVASTLAPDQLVAGAVDPVMRMSMGIGAMGVGTVLAAIDFK